MKRREPDFDESADMRLVELHRQTLGVARPQLGAWNTIGNVEGQPVDDPSSPEKYPATAHGRNGAVITLQLTASPAGEVIPGAVITLALAITNEGSAPAPSVRASVPLPGGASYRPGSISRDGRPESDEFAEHLFGEGVVLSNVAAGGRVTLLWKIGVSSGNNPLVITPNALSESAAVTGAKTLVISRREGRQTPFAAELDRQDIPEIPALAKEELPIYELDEEETVEYEAGTAALSEYQPGSMPPTPVTPPPAQPEPAPPPSQPAPIEEPGLPEPEPYTPEPPSEPPVIEPAAAFVTETVALIGRIDRPSVAYFARVFGGSQPPALVNHFLLHGALACTAGPYDSDPGDLGAHVSAQSQLLQRILLHQKMGKKEPLAQYAGQLIARIGDLRSEATDLPRTSTDPNAILLIAELPQPVLGVLHKIDDERDRWDFMKARQLTLALCGRRIASAAAPAKVTAAERALHAYAQTAAVQLQRLFVRMRIDRTTGILFASDEQLDAAAKSLIDSLEALFEV